jgi:sugar lactone lactonase YvrE
MPEPKTLLSGLVMGEAPRWHANRLWCTDMGAREVLAVDLAGKSEVVARVPSLGLGFLPDRRLLIVSMRDGLLLRREHDGMAPCGMPTSRPGAVCACAKAARCCRRWS